MGFGDHIKRQLKMAARGLTLVGENGAPTENCSHVLTYHSVGDRDHEMNVTPDAFRAQMEWLAENAHVCSLAEATEGCGGVAITFDDGYLDNLTNAAPVLSELGLPATVYVVPGRVGQWLDHDEQDRSAVLMTWDEVRELESSGWTIGGHTLTHQRLSTLNMLDRRTEIVKCTEVLEDELGHEMESFAYPYGSALDYNEYSKELVRQCGYKFAVSNRFGAIQPGADRWALRRIWIDRTDTLESFRAKAIGALDKLAWLDSAVGIRARRALNGLLKTG